MADEAITTAAAPAPATPAAPEPSADDIRREAEEYVMGKRQPPAAKAAEVPAPKPEQKTEQTKEVSDESAAAATKPAPEQTPAELAALKKELEVERKRRNDTQKAFHEGQEERARLARELEQLKAKVEGVATKVDSRLPKDPEDAAYESAMAKLREVSPELVTILETQSKKWKFSPEQVEQMVQKKLEEERVKLSADADKYARAQTWKQGVIAKHPDYFELKASPEFKDWYGANHNRVDSFLAGYDNFDPEGGVKMMDMFLTETGRRKKETPSPAPASTASDTAQRRAAIAASPAPGRSTPARPTAGSDDVDALYQEAAEWSMKRRGARG